MPTRHCLHQRQSFTINSAPAEHHYHGLKHSIRYQYATRNDGIYFCIYGVHNHGLNYPMELSLLLTAIRRTYFSTIVPIMMRLQLWHMATPIGLLVLRLGDHSVAFAFNSPAVRSHTRRNSNRPLPSHRPRLSSWQPRTSAECASLSVAFCGTSTFHKKLPPSHTKTMIDARLWPTRKNRLVRLDTLTSSILLFANGWNRILSSWNGLIHP